MSEVGEHPQFGQLQKSQKTIPESRPPQAIRDKLIGIPSKEGPEREEALKQFYLKKHTRQPELGQTLSDRQQSIESDASFLTDLYRRRMSAIGTALEFLSNTEQKKHFALVDMIAFKQYKGEGGRKSLPEINRLFDEIVGSIIVPRELFEQPSSPSETTQSRGSLDEFFAHTSTKHDEVTGTDIVLRDRVFDDGAGGIDLRGENYFLAQDKENPDQEGKLARILKDLDDGLQALSSIDKSEINNPRDYLLYLGLLDYLKSHALTIYHATTYFERLEIARLAKLSPKYRKKARNGINNPNQSLENPEVPFKDEQQLRIYDQHKKWAFLFAKDFTFMFYSALFGIDHDFKFNPENQRSMFNGLVEYIKQESSLNNDLASRLRYPETNHPLIIALGAHQAALTYPQTEVIVGIPTGGTETSILTQMIYKILRSQNQPAPKLFEIPVSIHTELYPAPSSDSITEFMNSFYPGVFQGKKVLLVDDNSESGNTVSAVSKALRKSGASSINIHIAEFNARKVTEMSLAKFRPTYFNAESSPTTMGLHLVGENNEPLYDEKIKQKQSTQNSRP